MASDFRYKHVPMAMLHAVVGVVDPILAMNLLEERRD